MAFQVIGILKFRCSYIDAGRTWHHWEVDKELPKDWHYSYRYIKETRIELDGTGRMLLYPFPDDAITAPELQTRDYGRHWSIVVEEAKSNNRMQRGAARIAR